MDTAFYLITAVMMLLFLAVSWLVTGLLHLSGAAEIMVRTLVTAVVFTAVGYLFWHRSRRKSAPATESDRAQEELSASEREIGTFVRDAEVRLAASSIGKDTKLSQLPVFFVVGETSSAKTSIFVHSGLEPDLLAGHVYQETAIVPTRPVNIWLAQRAVFVEPGGPLLSEPSRWVRLIKRLQPPRGRLFGQKPAPRAVIVCVDCETFLESGADQKLATLARTLHMRIGEISQVLGVHLPVYVIFTKLDRLASFTDFVRNLTDDEVNRVVGVTLPLRAGREQGGVYAEEESRRLAAAFEALFQSLCGKRLPFLGRENKADKLGPVYEFPREFRKLRNTVVRFLVDLSRPSQLRVDPFLRGFYFSGARPITVRESEPVARAASPEGKFNRHATGIFEQQNLIPEPAPVAGSARTQRVPQWLFLGHLFSNVILRDQAALGISGQSRNRETARRLLVAGASALFLLWSAAMTTSYFQNRGLEGQVFDAARGIGRGEPGGAGQQLPARDSLERLDRLRQTVQQLSQWERDGAPWSYRWGLYVGTDLYTPTRRLYFDRFQQLLFGSTQQSLVETMRKLPPKPGPNDEYKPTYDTLKGYLITTSHHEKSTREFLSPLLLDRWAAGRQIDPELAALARRQFDFYSDELFLANPFSSAADGDAVEQARAYLAQFNAVESIYQFIIAEASRQKPSVNFNRQFPGSAAYVTNNLDVAGAFTVEGAKFVDNAVNNVKKFFGGEAWVLGNRAYTNLDPVAIGPALRDRYRKDFIANWRAYLEKSAVVPYASVTDAAQKLRQLSSNNSYLLGMFCLASVNTAVADSDAAAPYQPVQFVTPPNCTDHYIQGNNTPYAQALVDLQASMERVAKSGGGVKDDLVTQTLNDASQAYKVTRQIAQSFRADRDGHVDATVEKLMEEPIRNAEAILGRLGPAQINTEARRFCGDFAGLTNKYPFNTTSQTDATLDELSVFFRPNDGRIAQFAASDLRNYIERRGSEWVRKSDSRVQISDAFLRFLNRATALSDALYRNGAANPSLTYTMKALPAEGVKSVTLSLDGQVLKAVGNGGDSKEFTWPGAAVRGAKLSGSLGGPELGFIVYDGLWAAFRFFGDADRFQATGSGYTLQWVPRQGQSNQAIRLDSGKALGLPFLLDLKGAPPIFQKGYLSGFQCVSDVAH